MMKEIADMNDAFPAGGTTLDLDMDYAQIIEVDDNADDGLFDKRKGKNDSSSTEEDSESDTSGFSWENSADGSALSDVGYV